MAKLFYYNFNPNLNRGYDNTFSFLVPLNRVFEQYLYKVLKNMETHDYIVNSQGSTDYLASINGGKSMRLIPDISITRGGNVEYILDAKYKDSSDLHSDIYQMLAYGIRYECNHLALVYPKYLEDKEVDMIISQIEIENYDKKILITKIKADLEIEPDVLGEKLYGLLGNIYNDDTSKKRW